MEWTKIDYDDTEVYATDFLNGVLVTMGDDTVFIPGYYVQEQRGDMDGPALWERPQVTKKFKLQLLEGE